MLTVIPKFNTIHRFQEEFEAISKKYTNPLSKQDQKEFEKWAVAISYQVIGLKGKNQYTEAIKVLIDIANLAAYYQQYNRQIISSILLGILYQRLGDGNKAVKYGEKGVALCYEFDCGDKLGYAYVQLATTYGLWMQFDKAFELFKIGIKYCVKYKDYRQTIGAYTTLSSMYGMSKKYEEALKYIYLALEYADKHKKKEPSYHYHYAIYSCCAKYYFALGQIDKAESYLEKSNQSLEEREGYDPRHIFDTKAQNYKLAGKIHFKKKDYTTSIKTLKKGIEHINSINFYPWDFSYMSYEVIGQAYYQLEEYHQAKKYFLQAIDLYHVKTKDYQQNEINVANVYLELAKTYMHLGEVEKSIDCISKAKEENIKFEALLKSGIIESIEETYDQSEQLRSDNVEIQQEFLRSQMNPHFIFNAVSTIQALILNNENKKASRYLSKFTNLMRSTLENSNYKRITLEEEIKSIEDYIALQQIRFEPSFQFSLTLDESLNIYESLIPPLLIQPFIENAILHGIKNRANGLIKLHFEQVKNSLKCTIEDNGCGIYSNIKATPKTTSHSTKIVQKRLKNLGLEYNVITKLDIIDKSTEGGQGTKVIITMPLFKEF